MSSNLTDDSSNIELNTRSNTHLSNHNNAHDMSFEDFEDFEDDADLTDIDNLPNYINGIEDGKSINNISKTVKAEHVVVESEAGQRIDKLASALFAEHSRAQLQEWLKTEQLTVNHQSIKPKYRVKKGDNIRLQAELQGHSADKPENIALDVVYEDDSVVVINKPVGMVVHPGAGNWEGTLVNALLYHYPDQTHLPRAGLVHRIDKNTSGLLVIGKTKAVQLDLQDQLKDKSVYRHYRCVVAGDAPSLIRQRVINLPIGRHRTQRTKMAITSTGKEAITHLIDITPLSSVYTLLDVRLETGRTHQIRVHLSHIGHPIIGDDVYGKRQQLRAGITQEQRDAVQGFNRQALHAYKLGFIHPESGQEIEVTAPMPDDMMQLIEVLSDRALNI